MRYSAAIMKCSLKVWLGSGVIRGAATAFLFCVFAAMADAQAASFQDYFTNRETIFTTNGTLVGDNSAATVETSEPKSGGKPGGHSLWISWVAPTNGVATFDTHGSSFDTLMSAYELNPTNATTMDRLQEYARNDDDPAAPPTSLVQIGAIAGHRYEIGIDGYSGATGTVVFHWSFLPANVVPPIIVNTPNDQSAKQGDTVNLTVNLIQSSSAQFTWFFNGIEDTNQTGTNFVISSLQATDVGRYQMRVTVGNGNNRVRFFTSPVEIQINSEGSTNTLAVDKLLDAPSTQLLGEDNGGVGGSPLLQLATKIQTTKGAAKHPIKKPIKPGKSNPVTVRPHAGTIGVTRGYNGSQVFNTTYATADPAEPLHCGVAGNSSYWLQYQPPTNGTVTFDTAGSTYDTVMEVYTYNGALNSYADLISVGCDNDSVSLHGPARVSFQAVKTRPYVIMVAGVNGAFGTAWLTYSLNTNQPAQPPITSSLVTTQAVLTGGNITLAPSIVGAPPLFYSWKKNGANVSGVTIPMFQINNAVSTNAATYTLTVTNDLGTINISNILHVVSPMNCAVGENVGGCSLAFPTVQGLRYTIESTTNLSGAWTTAIPSFIGAGGNFSTNFIGAGAKYFRVRID